jgi:hypothetical protein
MLIGREGWKPLLLFVQGKRSLLFTQPAEDVCGLRVDLHAYRYLVAGFIVMHQHVYLGGRRLVITGNFDTRIGQAAQAAVRVDFLYTLPLAGQRGLQRG